MNFQLLPNSSPFGARFSFSPSQGSIAVGQQCTVVCSFSPDILGEFHETFQWELLGSATSLPLTFKGKCIAPSFHFDIDRLAFGVVSYGFLNSKTLTLTNTSEVPMKYDTFNLAALLYFTS